MNAMGHESFIVCKEAEIAFERLGAERQPTGGARR